MKTFMTISRTLLVVLALLVPVCFQQASAQIATHVVLSEVYGGGGNSGSIYTQDYIELYNPTNASVDLSTWSVQYASATGSTWQVTTLSGSIPAHGFYLVGEALGAGGTTPLPTQDVTGVIAMSGTNGKVALVTGATGLLGGWLVPRLLDQGADVVCLVRDWVPQSELVRSRACNQVRIVRGDVCDQELLERVLGQRGQHVFHIKPRGRHDGLFEGLAVQRGRRLDELQQPLSPQHLPVVGEHFQLRERADVHVRRRRCRRERVHEAVVRCGQCRVIEDLPAKPQPFAPAEMHNGRGNREQIEQQEGRSEKM